MGLNKGMVLSALTAFCVILMMAGTPGLMLAQSAQQADALLGCWRVVPTPAINGQSSEIVALSASSSSDVWAVGNTYSGVPGSGYAGFILHWDGSAWGLSTMPVLTRTYQLADIKVLSPSDVWVVGTLNNSDQPPNPGVGESTDLVVFQWNGIQWNTSFIGQGVGIPGSVDATSDDDVWVVGSTPQTQVGGQSFVLHKDGNTWKDLLQGDAVQAPLSKVLAISRDDVWITGAYILHWNGQTLGLARPGLRIMVEWDWQLPPLSDLWLVGGSGPGYADHFNGQSWTATALMNPARFAYFQTIAATAAGDAWAAGYYGDSSDRNGLLEHWDGMAWTAIPNPVPGFGSQFNDIVAAGGDFWAVAGACWIAPDRTKPS